MSFIRKRLQRPSLKRQQQQQQQQEREQLQSQQSHRQHQSDLLLTSTSTPTSSMSQPSSTMRYQAHQAQPQSPDTPPPAPAPAPAPGPSLPSWPNPQPILSPPGPGWAPIAIASPLPPAARIPYPTPQPYGWQHPAYTTPTPTYGVPHAPPPPPFVSIPSITSISIHLIELRRFRQPQGPPLHGQAFPSSPQLTSPPQALSPTQWSPSQWQQGSSLTPIPSPVQSPYSPFAFPPQSPPPSDILSPRPQHPSIPIPIPTPTPHPGISPTSPYSPTYLTPLSPAPPPLPPRAQAQNAVYAPPPGPPPPPMRSRSTFKGPSLEPVYDSPPSISPPALPVPSLPSTGVLNANPTPAASASSSGWQGDMHAGSSRSAGLQRQPTVTDKLSTLGLEDMTLNDRAPTLPSETPSGPAAPPQPLPPPQPVASALSPPPAPPQQRQFSIPDDLPPMYDGPGTEEELTAEQVNLLLDGIESQVGQKNRGSVQITSVSFADFITYIPVVLGQPRDAEPMDRVKPAHASYNAMYVEKIDGLSGLDELDIELQSSYEGKVRR